MNDLWLGRKIRALRKNKGITQDDLAKALGITPQAVSKWERGLALPELPLIPALADHLECTIDALLREESGSAENSPAVAEKLPAAEDPQTMQSYHLLSLCQACIGEGDAECAMGRYESALLAYTKGLRGVESFLVPGEDGADAYPWKEMISVHWDLYLHRAVCYGQLMRQEEFQWNIEQAKTICLLNESEKQAFAQAMVQLGLSIESI